MAIEKIQTLIAPIYHDVYGFMQKYNLMGAWERCFIQHTRSVRNHLAERKSISVLYCATATAKNPQDVLNALHTLNTRAHITTMDLVIKPMSRLDRSIYHPVQAHSAFLPFIEKSFDYITTDFLLSKMSIGDIINTVHEWGRTLKDDGLITLTAGIKHPHSHTFERVYDSITKPLYGIHFLPIEVLRQIFYSARLEAKIEKIKFDRKPFMYRYPDDLLIFIEATPVKDHDENVRKARVLLHDALFIHQATGSEKQLCPLGIEESIKGLMSNDFLTTRTASDQIFGFIRITDLTEDWSEIGSLYIDPRYRNAYGHHGTSLLQQALCEVKQRNKKAIVFSGNPTVTRTLEKYEAVMLRTLPRELLIPLMRNRLMDKETSGKFLRTLFTRSSKNSIYALF